MDDQVIIENICRKQKNKAITQLYKKLPQIEKTLFQDGANKTEVADLFQEALITLLIAIEKGKYRQEATITTYLTRVCLYNWWKEKEKRKKVNQSSISLIHEIEINEIGYDWEKEQLYKSAEKAFDKLGKPCKKLLEYFYLQKKSMFWIAKKLGYKSDKVAKNQKYKCLKKAQMIYKKST